MLQDIVNSAVHIFPYWKNTFLYIVMHSKYKCLFLFFYDNMKKL